MIYVPVDVRKPIASNPTISIQRGLTNNFPEIIFELHDCCKYYDLGDNCTLFATITNTYLESCVFTGELRILNPHRGQILCRLNYEDFSETGFNVLTVLCDTGEEQVSFQKSVFVESINPSILGILRKE